MLTSLFFYIEKPSGLFRYQGGKISPLKLYWKPLLLPSLKKSKNALRIIYCTKYRCIKHKTQQSFRTAQNIHDMLISPYPPHRKATVSVIAVTCLCNVRTIHTIPVRVGNLRGGDGGEEKKKKSGSIQHQLLWGFKERNFMVSKKRKEKTIKLKTKHSKHKQDNIQNKLKVVPLTSRPYISLWWTAVRAEQHRGRSDGDLGCMAWGLPMCNQSSQPEPWTEWLTNKQIFNSYRILKW